jgi:capsular exopolysaccharide synthesis family protein
MITGGAALGTLALVLLGISWLEYRVRRVDSAEDVPRQLGLRVVGALPATPKAPLLGLPGQAANQEVYWRSRLNENVNAIRALLLRQSQAERLQAIMVTSASIGEGKTSLACHLATSLARAGRRTLLLDCDLRSPTAHRVFDLPLEPGLSEVLRGEVPLEEASHPIALGELRMITAGRCDAEALHLLGLEPLREVLERLRGQYEFIIVDTPPILPVADALLVGQHVDAAIFSILRDVSRVPKVQTARERLAALGVRVLGAVVAGTRVEKYGADYYYAAPAAAAGALTSPAEEA